VVDECLEETGRAESVSKSVEKKDGNEWRGKIPNLKKSILR
jgi:hypothetical protein